MYDDKIKNFYHLIYWHADLTKAAKINASDFCIASSGKCLSAAITGPIPPPGPISGVHYGYCVEVFSPFSTVGQCSPGRTGIDSIAPAICAFSGCECPAEYLKIRQAVTDTVGTVSQSLKSAIVCVKK